MSIDIKKVNGDLKGKSPHEVIQWALSIENPNAILTTNFRPHEAVIVHAVTQVKPDIPVVWIDSGYNMKATYKFAQKVINDFKLNILTYTPLVTAANREAIYGGIPSIDDKEAHDLFTAEVKLEPFNRALQELKPKIWLTALRREQTPHRETLDFVVEERNGIIKVSPFFYFTEAEMDEYLEKYNLPNENAYFDPTKVLDKRECGLHLAK